MTYCLGVVVDEGVLMVADTRTNAGVDNVSCYRKLHCLADLPDRQIHIASSGNLSVSQRVVNRLSGGQALTLFEPSPVHEAGSLFEVAEAVGAVLREGNEELRAALGKEKCGATLLLGGRIGNEPPRLFLIYPEGNFIECRADVPYLQIGETKYGRPILDRVITRSTPLAAAVKIAFLSFDSAMRSNLSVARPLDLMMLPAAAGAGARTLRIEQDDVYFNELSRRWSSALVEAAGMMPDPHFLDAMHPATRQIGNLRAC